MADPKTTWSYNADEDEAAATASGSKQSVAWQASEYIDHKQGAGWFLMLALGAAVLAGAVYLITKDFFAVGVILVLGLVVGVFAHRTPRQLSYELSESGLTIDKKFYPYRSFKSFSIIQEGPLTSLNFTSVKRFMPTISVYFSPTDQEKIIDILQEHLAYEQRSLEAVDRLTRSLRF